MNIAELAQKGHIIFTPFDEKYFQCFVKDFSIQESKICLIPKNLNGPYLLPQKECLPFLPK